MNTGPIFLEKKIEQTDRSSVASNHERMENNAPYELPARLRRAPIRIPKASHFIFTHALRKVWLLGLLGAAYAAMMVVYKPSFQLAISLEALLSFAVSIMLGVRVNQAYNRWWEARTQWGKLVNISRNLAIKLRDYSDPDLSERIEMQRLVQGFPRALKNHLRGETCLQDVRGFRNDSANPKHVPAFIVQQIYKLISKMSASDRCTEFQALIIDSEARELLEVAGACERIKNTLMPPSFPAFIQFSLGLVILSLPLELSRSIGWFTVPATTLATVLLCGGESIAYALERPFGVYTDDLDLESYCNGIDKVTAEILECRGYTD